MSQAPAISIRAIDIAYGPSRIVEQLSLDIPQGQVTAIIGPNGCGKSTLLKSLVRINKFTGGTIAINGQLAATMSPRQLARQVAFLPQILPVPEGITVRQLVAYGRSPHNDLWGRLDRDDRSIVDGVMQQMAISDLSTREVAELSGGQRQRVWIAMILAQQTPIVLLDEPTTFMDINHQVELLELTRLLVAGGKTVVVVLHDLNQAFRYADFVVVMKGGRCIASGTPEAIATPQMLSDVFSVSASVSPDPEVGKPMLVIRAQQER